MRRLTAHVVTAVLAGCALLLRAIADDARGALALWALRGEAWCDRALGSVARWGYGR